MSDHFFDEDEQAAELVEEDIEENGKDKDGKEKLYKLKPTFARLFE